MHHVLEFNQSQWLKPYIEFNTQKRIKAEKNENKDRKALYKLMKKNIYGKIMGNVRNRIDVKLVANEKYYLKCTLKPSYMSHKIFDNNLVAIYKSKFAIKLNKLAYIGMCILEMSKVWMYEFHGKYIKNKYDNKPKLLLTDTDSLIYEIITEDVYDNFCSNKEILDFSNYLTKSKWYDNSNKLVIGKMKDETIGVTIEEFFGFKPNMHLFLVDNSEHKKAKGVNKNVVVTISHSAYKDVLLNNRCIRHSMNKSK